MQSVEFTVYIVQCTVYCENVQFTVYSIQCTGDWVYFHLVPSVAPWPAGQAMTHLADLTYSIIPKIWLVLQDYPKDLICHKGQYSITVLLYRIVFQIWLVIQDNLPDFVLEPPKSVFNTVRLEPNPLFLQTSPWSNSEPHLIRFLKPKIWLPVESL